MKTFSDKFLRSFLSLLLILMLAQALSGQDAVFRAGAAKAKITPVAGSIMGNSYGLTICEGVHDDLYARTLVFDYQGTRAAFIALDLVSLPHVLVMETRKLVGQRTGIPASNVIMTATHCHAGPQMNPLFWNAVGGLPKQKSEEYMNNLPGMITGSVLQAVEKLQPVRVSVSTVKETEINFNRRYLMKDGSFRMNPGRLNKNAVRPAGPVDPDLSVVYFESLDSRPVAILVNFALHPAIVTDSNISADFPGFVCDQLAKVKGDEMITVYTNGTSGNINHIDVSRRDQLDGYEESARIGTVIAADVLKALSSLHPIGVNSMKVGSMAVDLPIPKVNPDDTKWAQNIIARYGKANPPAFDDVVKAWKILDQTFTKGSINDRHRTTTTIPLTDDGSALMSEVQAITLGNELALAGFPGDAFTELGMAIKQNSPYLYTIVSEQSGNGSVSYVPNRKGVLEGGYEGLSARFTPGGGEKLVDTVIRILTDFFPYK